MRDKSINMMKELQDMKTIQIEMKNTPPLKIPGEGNGYPLQYSGLEKSMGPQRAGHD